MNNCFILAFSFLITTFSFAQTSTILNLEITNTSTMSDFPLMEVYIETSPAFIVGDEGPNPNIPIPLFAGTTMTTSLSFVANVDVIDLFITKVCLDSMGAFETTILSPVTLYYNGELDSSGFITMDFAMELSCGEGGEPLWDCPNLNANIGSSCQGGWGVVDENCDCAQVEIDCLGAAGIDITLLMASFANACANQNNIDSWLYCGLMETLVAAEMGDGEACATIVEWVEVNNWDGTWTPDGGNTGDWDCAELGYNVGDSCVTAFGNLGEIDFYCDCVDSNMCDLTVMTILLANDDGSGNGSVEAIAEGGTLPYVYEWQGWQTWDPIGTTSILDNCEAGTYFIQVTDDAGCTVFGTEQVGLSIDTLDWDCPNLNMNIGEPCQGGWGMIDENCDCTEVVFSEGCEVDFSVVQAYEDNNIIPFELFIYLWDYNESNEYSWNFGDEGSIDEPFPTWTYETNGPYVLCLTVSNDDLGCSTTYCQNIEVDSLGWISGIQDGFSINVINGDENPISGSDEFSDDSFSCSVFPNPMVGSELHVHWLSSSIDQVECTLMSLDGKVVARNASLNSTRDQTMTMNVGALSSGLYLLKIRQGLRVQTQKVSIR